MTFDLQDKARTAQTELHEALAALASARTDYENGVGHQLGQAKAAQEALAAKIEAAQAEADAAAAAFDDAFKAAGFEANDTTRAALDRKNDALAMADVMKAAHAKGAKEMQEHAAQASTQARRYAAAYERAYIAHAQAEGYKALQEAGPQIARAMALAAHAPCRDSAQEDSLGRPAPTQAIRNELVAARWAFILNALKALAQEQPEFEARPHVEALGVLDVGALTARDVMTPAQIQVMRKGALAEM